MDKQTNGVGKGIAIGAGVGILAGVAGVIAGVLFAPKSGEETRADIKNYIVEMKDKIAEELVNAGEVTKEKYDEIVAKIVKVYELEKKITTEDAKGIQEKLDANYEQIVKAIKE